MYIIIKEHNIQNLLLFNTSIRCSINQYGNKVNSHRFLIQVFLKPITQDAVNKILAHTFLYAPLNFTLCNFSSSMWSLKSVNGHPFIAMKWTISINFSTHDLSSSPIFAKPNAIAEIWGISCTTRFESKWIKKSYVFICNYAESHGKN